MKKDLFRFINLTILGITIVLLALFAFLYHKIDQKLNELDNYQSSRESEEKIADDLESTVVLLNEGIENLILEQNSIISKLNGIVEQQEQLEKEYKNLEELVSIIPIDETLIVKKKVEEWLDLFRDESAQEVDIRKVSEIMAVGPNFYYEWYPEFETRENMMIIHHMIDVIFQYGEAISVSPGFLLNNQYFVEDTDGNRFEINYDDDEIFSLFTFASLCDNMFSDFVGNLKAKDVDELHKFLFYESFGPYEDDIKYIQEEYIKPLEQFVMDELDYIFDGIDMAGFRYVIFDQSGHEMTFYVNHSDSITIIENEESARAKGID